MRSPDLIDVIESCYIEGGPDDSWLRRVLEVSRPHFDQEAEALAYLYDARTADVRWSSLVTTEGSSSVKDTFDMVFARLSKGLEPKRLAAFFRPERVISSASSFLGAEFSRSGIKSHLARDGWADVISIMAANPEHSGCHIAFATRARTEVTRKQRLLWTRLAAHIAAGMRLRRSPGVQADAVIAPGGRITHAQGPARSRRAREQLTHEARNIERARSRVRRCSPDEALELWRGLVAGHWSLVEEFDSDGRRYLVARMNEPGVPPGPIPLTMRQQQVLAYAAIGHSNKLIGYQLGISASAVAQHLLTANKKLGVRSRIEAIRAYRHMKTVETE